MKPILVTTALPYANGSIHLGHLVEYIQADCWVRAQKMLCRDVTFVCADDAHGTPVMLSAEQKGVGVEDFIKTMQGEHIDNMNSFGIRFDNYHSTHSEENKNCSQLIYRRLQKAELIECKMVEQYYDEYKELFLPDRFIKGNCPKCKTPDQYGDACESCGAAYHATDLIEPYSTLSNSQPIIRNSEHFFFKLSNPRCKNFLKQWVSKDRLQDEVANKATEWLTDDDKNQKNGLNDWDISRDAPYFGFEIPDAPGKYFYVWLDAPIGYMASHKNLIDKNNLNWEEIKSTFWDQDSEGKSELYHFIGKDIIYFHTLFWPAMLHFSGHRTPTSIFVHGFLTVNGEKMSKSRGTFITANHYLNCGINPEYLRYYFASRLNNRIEDIDFNLMEFEQKINSDLIGKVINIVSRAAPFITKKFDGALSANDVTEIFNQKLPEINNLIDGVTKQFINREFSQAIRLIINTADCVNRYCDIEKPWEIAKNQNSTEHLHTVCTILINAFRLIIICLKPVMPDFVSNAEKYLNQNDLQWQDGKKLLPPSHKVERYHHLLKRIDTKAVINLTNNVAQSAGNSKQPKKMESNNMDSENNLITIDDFKKAQLQIGEILSAEEVAESNKLLKLQVSLGDGNNRTIFAGIKGHYAPETLIGKHVVIVANLQPRKMRFGLSEGMLLAATNENDDSVLFLLSPDDQKDARPRAGMKVS